MTLARWGSLLLLGGFAACGADDVAGGVGNTEGTGSTGTPMTGMSTLSTATLDTTTPDDTSVDDSTSTSASDSSATDGGSTSSDDSGTTDDSETTGDSEGTTSAVDCEVGERVYQGDGCNFCDCTNAGLENCTARTCVPINDGCDYDGSNYAYAVVFDSTDACNECVCAASGLACTRRPECVGGLEEGAILLESLDAPCGDIDEFTGQWVLDWLDPAEFTGPFDYNNTGPLYPETLADSEMTVRALYDGGYIVCRIPQIGQEALDIEAIVEWQTADGALNEGQQTYIRRNYSGFLFAVTTVVTVEPGDIYGTYDHDCLDAGALVFGPLFNDDGTAGGTVFKTCETDIGLSLGEWTSP